MKQYWERLKDIREDRDLSQSDIAKLLKTTQQVYSRYECGINEMPIRHLVTLCKYYNVSADHVLGLDKDDKNRL
ncbi:MAG: helix-turn-helix transcriptional regulator [Clostridia bacterium]|nr:helix-turn-helix transcriptional regulator [Clostridia bacterium]